MINNFLKESWFPEAEGWEVNQVFLGESKAQVWKIRRDTGGLFFLKRTTDQKEAENIVRAHEVFSSSGMAPSVRWNRETPDASWILMETAPGIPAFEVDFPVGKVLGRFLKTVHQLPTETLDQRFPTTSDLFINAGLSREETKSILERYPEEKVVSHGDCCLPNLLIDSARQVQMIDLGGVGLYDRYRDLERILWSFDYNGLASQKTAFLEAYGLPEPDLDKLNAYRSLGI